MKVFSKNELVKEVNRIYHAEEAAIYDAYHPEIFEQERVRWEMLAEFIPKKQDGITLLDIGSGTGFVVEVLLPHLSPEDSVVLTDISPEMLERAKKRFASRVTPHMQYVVADGETLPLPGASADAVTLNSVLHHLPDTSKFLKEIDRVLKPGRVLIIAHEPNRLYWQNLCLRLSFWIMQKWYGFTHRAMRAMHPHHKTPATSHDAYAKIYKAVNGELVRRGLISHALSPEEIQQYVDVHSPTASGVADASKGFNPEEFASCYLPGYQALYFETMAHLGKFSADANGFLALLEKILRALFPRSGSSFALVLEKPRDTD